MEPLAFQEQIVGNHCWGCGAQNENGLGLKSYWDGDESVSSFTPQPFHTASAAHVVNGGILASLIDCHCIFTAIAAAYKSEGREISSEPPIWYATGSLNVSYKDPTPIDRQVDLRARITEMTERRINLSCTLSVDGKDTVQGEVVAVRVPLEWMQAPQ